MGLIKAGIQSIKSTLADEWLEFVSIKGIDSNDILVKREYPKKGGSNYKGTEGVLTNGTRITVPEGMAMMIVDQGKVVEFTAEPGEFIYDSSTESSMFYGGFGQGLKESFNMFKDRFKFGGQVPKDQRVYYINLREIQGITFGTAEAIAFPDYKYEIAVYLRFYGKYSIKIVDPFVFIANVVSSMPKDTVTLDIFTKEGQIKEEFITHLTTSLTTLAYEEKASFVDIPRYQTKLAKIMNDELDEEWKKNRGIEIVSVAIPSISLTDESKQDIRKYDEVNIADKKGAGMMTAASAQAMRDAAKNEGGMTGTFMGMNVGNMMAQNTVDVAGTVFKEKGNDTTKADESWNCPKCKQDMEGDFCTECGEKRPKKTFCAKCGKQVDSNDKFCKKCGNKLED